MEHLIGWAVNDVSHAGALLAAHPTALGGPRQVERGVFGVGFHQFGEILVKKRPVSGEVRPEGEVAGLNVPHAVAFATDAPPGPMGLGHCQPLRYQSWLFAMAGADGLDRSLIDRIAARLTDFIGVGRLMSTVAEAVMMLYMRALLAAGALVRRGLSTHGIHRALGAATGALVDLVGGRAGLDAALMLHSDGHLFALSLGRPLRLRAFEGLPSPGGRPTSDARHLRAVSLTLDPPERTDRVIGAFEGVEVDAACAVRDLETDA
ncbi:MAG: hypothetical protein H6744_11680 [Deltaproteobacteria bacterium]|nr:hypothetical protein [Deltaproteobacteria bacterium]